MRHTLITSHPLKGGVKLAAWLLLGMSTLLTACHDDDSDSNAAMTINKIYLENAKALGQAHHMESHIHDRNLPYGAL